MIRPASMTETTRATRTRAISGCQVTSTKWQPNECFENLGFAAPAVVSLFPRPVTRRTLARLSRSANGTPEDPSAFENTFSIFKFELFRFAVFKRRAWRADCEVQEKGNR